MAESPALHVVHNEKAQRFEAAVTGGIAHSDYRRSGNVLDMVHTEVPAEAGGGGIAGKIVKAAFDYASANGLKIRPSCPYVRGYMQRHPETHGLLAPGVTL